MGKPSADSMKAIGEELGLDPEATVDFVAFRRSQVENAVYESVGGREVYDGLIEWARSPEGDKTAAAALDEAIKTGQVESITTATTQLFMSKSKSQGAAPASFHQGGTSTPTGGVAF